MNMIDKTQNLIHASRIKDRNSSLSSMRYGRSPYKTGEATSSPSHPRPHVRIIDRPCGTGKTTEILRSFKSDQRYLVVVPLLSEVRRVIQDAVVSFVEPRAGGESDTKAEHLDVLLKQGLNVVTTHKLFTEIGTAATLGLLDDYHIIVDEVLDVVETVPGKTSLSFDQFYLNDGYATEGDDGLITPTEKWDEQYQLVSDTLDPRLYKLAKAQTLYRVDGKFFLWALSASLLRCGRSLTVYTYMAKGSLMLAYLKKLGIAFHHERYADEAAFRASARQLIDIRSIPALERLSFSYTGQTETKGHAGREKLVSTGLKNLKQRSLTGIDLDEVIITCAKQNWQKEGPPPKPTGFAIGSRMFGAHWLPNTTRGTNDYAHASVCIYLYDQHINPCIRRWLGMMDRAANDLFASAELIQWVYRSRVRRGLPITLYLPSNRMRALLLEWLEREADAHDTVTLAA
jgi:hypothetical protein